MVFDFFKKKAPTTQIPIGQRIEYTKQKRKEVEEETRLARAESRLAEAKMKHKKPMPGFGNLLDALGGSPSSKPSSKQGKTYYPNNADILLGSPKKKGGYRPII